ncbi:MAG TPA: YebC/PmpR family DNA-binding transcriptional regulator [Armatimonadota bacterium]|nr:YebC/PmpR family DNA-binding transcriptional regulator [Armatimonadota bacterium]
MAGHSKWANRVHRKSRQDAKRGKLFGKLSKEIIVSARLGGGDPDINSRLRIAIQSARDVSMPSDNIERAIKRGSGDDDAEAYEEINYEGYGPGGAAMLLECMTDNRTRTVAEVRKLFDKSGGNLGDGGSVAWMFEQKGVLVINKAGGVDGDQLFMAAVEGGAEDVVEDEDEGYFEVTCEPSEFSNVRDALTEAGHEFARAELTYVPTSTTPVPDDKAKQLLNLVEALDDHDDVQKVHSNFEVSDEVLASLEA